MHMKAALTWGHPILLPPTTRLSAHTSTTSHAADSDTASPMAVKYVTKKDGTLEAFDEDKVRRTIFK